MKVNHNTPPGRQEFKYRVIPFIWVNNCNLLIKQHIIVINVKGRRIIILLEYVKLISTVISLFLNWNRNVEAFLGTRK